VLLSLSISFVGCDQPRKTTNTVELPSRWIRISRNTERPSDLDSLITQDFERLKATLPTLVQAIPARHVNTVAQRGESMTQVNVCATTPDMLDLLTEGAKVELTSGSFLPAADAQGKTSAVISAQLAQKLFEDENPVEKTISLGGAEFIVIGVVGKKGDGLIQLNHHVYVSMNAKVGPIRREPERLDRIWLKVGKLSDVAIAEQVIDSDMKRYHPEMEISVRSTYPLQKQK
jgi:hypothetical protein